MEPEDLNIAPAMETFLNELLDLMEDNSINRKSIDWLEFRDRVLQEAKDAQILVETYPAIELALEMLEDHHSLFISVNSDEIYDKTGPICNDQTFSIPSMPSNVGYVQVPDFFGIGQVEIDYAEAIQQIIADQDSPEIEGWVVDIRGNGGGNMWAMVSGIGPILGQGVAGYFVDPNDVGISWSYVGGTSKNGSTVRVSLPNPYELINKDPKVAVLVDQSVASSGEAIAVSFIGRENSRSFGRPTCGLSTVNRGFPLTNGSFIILTGSYLADRNIVKYGSAIVPDEEISQPAAALDRAIEWIQG